MFILNFASTLLEAISLRMDRKMTLKTQLIPFFKKNAASLMSFYVKKETFEYNSNIMKQTFFMQS